MKQTQKLSTGQHPHDVFRKPKQAAQIRKTEIMKSLMKKYKSIQKQLRDFEYTNKFYSLTQNNVFFFNIYKVINQTNNLYVANLCSSFFQFLILRLISYYFQLILHQSADPASRVNGNHRNRNSGKNKDNKVYSVVDQTKQNLQYSETLQESSAYATDFRQNKSRANSTALFSQNAHLKNNKYLQKFKCTQNNRKGCQNLKLLDKQNTNQISDEEYLSGKILKSVEDIKQAYFQLTEIINSRYRVAKLQIISFLITLIAPGILRPYINIIERQFNTLLPKKSDLAPISRQKHKSNQNSQFLGVQQQVYIVLTYQTIGSLVSPSVYRLLKKKYMKHVIFVSDSAEQSIKLMQSLKHIKQKLKSEKNMVLIKGRRNCQRQKIKRNYKQLKSLSIEQEDDELFTKQKMKQFIKQTLKTKQINTQAKSSDLKNDFNQYQNKKIGQTFYPFFRHSNSSSKFVISKQNPSNKKSVSIISKLNLQNFKHNKNPQDIKKKKCIINNQKTFIKIKPHNYQRSLSKSKAIKSQRSSYKFNKLDCQVSPIMIAPGIVKSQFQIQPIQQMKLKIQKFKSKALKDLQTIDSFKQSLSLKDARKDISHSQARIYYDPMFDKMEEKQLVKQQEVKQESIVDKTSNRFQNLRTSIRQRQQVWHYMYNIRNQTNIPVKKQAQQQKIAKSGYKLAKNSDKFRKNRQLFNQSCIRRIQYLEDDIGVLDRMRMKIR